MSDLSETANVFEDPQVAEIWLEVADITGDAEVAKDVISYLALALWNLPWVTWEQVHKSAAAK